MIFSKNCFKRVKKWSFFNQNEIKGQLHYQDQYIEQFTQRIIQVLARRGQFLVRNLLERGYFLTYICCQEGYFKLLFVLQWEGYLQSMICVWLQSMLGRVGSQIGILFEGVIFLQKCTVEWVVLKIISAMLEILFQQ